MPKQTNHKKECENEICPYCGFITARGGNDHGPEVEIMKFRTCRKCHRIFYSQSWGIRTYLTLEGLEYAEKQLEYLKKAVNKPGRKKEIERLEWMICRIKKANNQWRKHNANSAE